MSIIIVAGTNRKNAITYKIAEIYSRLLTQNGAENEIICLEVLPEDFIVSGLYDNGGKNDKFNPIREKMWEAQKYVFIVPEYNGSLPGVLKVFIDGLKFPGTFKNKKAALVGLSAGVQGGALALSHLNDIISYLMGNVLGNRVKLMSIEKNMKDGVIENALYMQLLEAQAKDLIAF
ncbi:MAG: NAD(P)H-dependent oxidoreductase [Bacteroidota bacterium]|nr:NAD(P)H-dependent oxidoreductase [Bacteroidota bacterium]